MKTWKQLFAFTKQERNGIAVFAVLLIGAVAYFLLEPVLFQPASIPSEIPKGYDPNPVRDDQQIVLHEKREQPEIAFYAGQRTVYQQNELFLFNPNGLAESEWIRLGLSPAQARSVKNFESKGGAFRSKEDVKKLYVISPEKFNELEPYIVIPFNTDSVPRPYKKKESVVLELNTADTTQLVKINGIGPVFAKRIVAYRNWLGGFHSKEQLLEVNGITEEVYNNIKSSFTCDSTYITKMNVNTAGVAELKRHPYFTPGAANALVNYRKQHGNFHQLSDVKQCKLITPQLYDKLLPYLTL